ncbi:MAG: pantothenate synthetase [Bacteroidia bacterium]|nr:MAG: pantothenate synthetase [Bacteroidia bacterium]
MLILKTAKELLDLRNSQKNKSIGFVPTMGALHQGHLELVKHSIVENDFTYVSIFVNPLQFNNKEDLEKYPRTIEKDIGLLESIDTDAVFIPEYAEVYNAGISYDTIDLSYLNSILEGPKRPGHFDGVVKVVSILFKLIQPDKAYFGLKDFQQVKVIEKLIKDKQYPIRLVPCPTVREVDGLAMSSRNVRLSPDARKKAAMIYQWLLKARDLYQQGCTVKEIEKIIIEDIQKHSDFQLDYFEIRDANDLSPIHNAQQPAVALIAVYLDGVRLIDNLML